MKKVLINCSVSMIVAILTNTVAAQDEGRKPPANRTGSAPRGRGSTERERAGNGWFVNYSQARNAARATGKPIMLVFRCVP
jgi:hypothetical protein